MSDSGRFITAMPTVVGKRLTYKTLIGAELEDRIANEKGEENAGGKLPN